MKIVLGVVAGVVVFIVVVVGLVAMLGPGAGGAHGGATPVRIEAVEPGELLESVSAPGTVEARTKVAISAKISSRIMALPYDEGDTVTKGDPDADPPVPPSVLVRLDATDLEAQLRSAKARYAAQRAQLEVEKARITSSEASLHALNVTLAQAKRDLDRNLGLRETRDVAQATLDNAQMHYDELAAQYEASEASLEASVRGLRVMEYNLEAAEADIARAEDDLSYTTITSPIDGVVTALNAEVGELVMTGTMNNPGTVILEVADLSQMLVVVQLDEADVAMVEPGQKAEVRLLAYPDRIFEGAVESIALKATEGVTRYFKTEILIRTEGDRVLSGLTADADIQIADYESVLTVPTQAVMGRPYDDLPLEVRDGNELIDSEKAVTTVVYRLIDGKAVVTPVKIGASDLTRTVIEGGLSEGDTVVIGPYKVLESLSHDQAIIDEREVEKDTDKKETESTEAPESAPTATESDR